MYPWLSWFLSACQLVSLSACQLVSLSVSWVLGSKIRSTEADLNRQVNHLTESIEVSQQIIYLDEVLTMSARMYALSSQSRWKKRYYKHVPLLDQAFLNVQQLEQHQNNEILGITESSSANQKLIAMEEESFQLVETNKSKQAYQLLTSLPYEDQKQIYSSGIDRVLEHLQQDFQEGHQKAGREFNQFTVLAVVLFPLLILLSWLLATTLVNRSNRSLKEAFSRLQATHDASAEGVLIISLEGEIIDFNSRFAEIWSFSEEQLTQLSDDEALRLACDQLENPEQFIKGVEALYATPEATANDVLALIDGKIISRHTRPQWVDSRVVGRIWNFRDITEEWTAQQSKDNFLASMSHELRTPLTSIIGNSEFLLDEGVCGGDQCTNQNVNSILRSIKSAGKNQLALVNGILDMSKIESGKFTIDHPPYDFTALLEELETMFSKKAADAGVCFVLDQKDREPYLLMGDGQRIGQVLINLIGNAIKFTEQGEVRLTSWVNKGRLFMQVKDTGIGMPREMIDQLFQRFHQADTSISRRFGGSGLGLYISENLVELMEGEIDASSQEGEGSVFTLNLPYESTDTPVPSMDVQSGRDTSVLEEKLSGHILIAEDTPELQLLERRILESIGLTVTTVKDGQEAVDQVNQNRFDLILMDMQMPNLNGIEATRTLRQQGHTLPIIALTANVMQKHRDAFNDAGCDGFLGKPIDKSELKKVLKHRLSKNQQAPHVQSSVEEEANWG